MVRVLDESGPEGDEYVTNGAPESPPHWEAIFNAPEYAAFIKVRKTATAREYETRTNSVLKSLLVGSLNAGDFPDAAAILHYGPQFAAATGGLADSDDRAKRVIDLVTSPSNPVVVFALAAIPLVAQVMRNHETQIAEVPGAIRSGRAERKARKAAGTPKPAPRFTLKVLGRTIPIRFRMRLKVVGTMLQGVRSQTQDPISLTGRVFSDTDLISALEKQGIRLVNHADAS